MTAIEQVRELQASAQYHKRESAYHRRRAREKMAELERVCKEFKIELQIIREEREFHGEQRPAS